MLHKGSQNGTAAGSIPFTQGQTTSTDLVLVLSQLDFHQDLLRYDKSRHPPILIEF